MLSSRICFHHSHFYLKHLECKCYFWWHLLICLHGSQMSFFLIQEEGKNCKHAWELLLFYHFCLIFGLDSFGQVCQRNFDEDMYLTELSNVFLIWGWIWILFDNLALQFSRCTTFSEKAKKIMKAGNKLKTYSSFCKHFEYS